MNRSGPTAGYAFTTQPLPKGAEWGPVVLADTVGGMTIGAIAGVGVAAIVEPLIYPGERQTLNEAGSHLVYAKRHFMQSQQNLQSAEASLGNSDPATLQQLRRGVAAEAQTVAGLQQQANALPDHSSQTNELGMGFGLAAGLAACAVKLGIQKIRTDRARSQLC